MIQQGEIYWVTIPESGDRPVIVISKDVLNRGYSVLVVPCTTSKFDVRSKLPNCVALNKGSFGLTADCVAQCENAFAIDVSLLKTPDIPIGKLNEGTMRLIIKAVGNVLNSDCQPI